jgi:hypothetical protein
MPHPKHPVFCTVVFKQCLLKISQIVELIDKNWKTKGLNGAWVSDLLHSCNEKALY